MRALSLPESIEAPRLDPQVDVSPLPLRVAAVGDGEELAALERPWRELFRRALDPTPFQSFEWQATWWKHHGQGRLWILTAHRGDALVALMPLTIASYRGTQLRQVRFAGAPLSDVQEILSLPGERAATSSAFLTYLADEAHLWDLCDFPDQRTGTALTTVLPPPELTVELVHHRVCPFLALPGSWDEFLGGLGTHMRSNVKRRRKNLTKHFAVEYVTVTDAAGLPSAMAALFALHGRRWRRRGVGGAFSGERMQQFHLEVAERFLARDWLRLHLLKLDGVPAAALYCFQYQERVYYYLGGFVPELARFGLGVALQSYAIEQAIAGGASEFDMLRGDETYKYYWRCQQRNTRRLILSTAGLRSRLLRGIHRVERYLEHRGLALQRRLWGGQGPKTAQR
jgi:CelD/BcsL family acetyltransferase involved in cellulose biosynthesis